MSCCGMEKRPSSRPTSARRFWSFSVADLRDLSRLASSWACSRRRCSSSFTRFFTSCSSWPARCSAAAALASRL
eukprot:4597299-Pleurochrysis_carterae.AAC.1